jgi:hypothetical protein
VGSVPDISTIRVPADFEDEFPGASRSAAEVAANLVRTATALVAEIDRPPRQAAGLSASEPANPFPATSSPNDYSSAAPA